MGVGFGCRDDMLGPSAEVVWRLQVPVRRRPEFAEIKGQGAGAMISITVSTEEEVCRRCSVALGPA